MQKSLCEKSLLADQNQLTTSNFLRQNDNNDIEVEVLVVQLFYESILFCFMNYELLEVEEK